MKILVVGKGGREHAIVTALHESPAETEIYSFPGSDAICRIAKRVDVAYVDHAQKRLVDECSGLKGVAGRLSGHLGSRELSQLAVDQREELRPGGRIPGPGGVE